LKPATADEAPYVQQLIESLRGEQLSRVTYVYPEFWTWTPEYQAEHIDEVDMDIVLHFAAGGHLKISWAMAGLIEGLELSRDDFPLTRLAHVDVSSSPYWARFVGNELKDARVLWHPANEGVPERSGGWASPLAVAYSSRLFWESCGTALRTISLTPCSSFLMN
jgi:hypothetical protein